MMTHQCTYAAIERVVGNAVAGGAVFTTLAWNTIIMQQHVFRSVEAWLAFLAELALGVSGTMNTNRFRLFIESALGCVAVAFAGCKISCLLQSAQRIQVDQ